MSAFFKSSGLNEIEKSIGNYDLPDNRKQQHSPIFAQISSLKYFGAILLLAFVVQTFSKTFIMAEYYTNTAAYTKNCENKAKPKLHCNGKCQMMKKIQQEENKDKQHPERKLDGKEEVLSSKSFYTILHCSILPVQTIYPLIEGRSSVEMPRSIFHPPGTTA